MILCRPPDNPFGIDMIGVLERKAAVRTLLLKLSYFKFYGPYFDLFFTAGFFNVAIKVKLGNFIISSNVAEFAGIFYCCFVYF